jgi:hypothetical protein
MAALPGGMALAEALPALLDSPDEETAPPDLGTAEIDAAAARQIPIPPDTGEVRIPFRMGKAQPGLTLTLVWADGAKTDIQFRTGQATFKMKSPTAGDPERTLDLRLPDACLDIPALKTRYFVRPNPNFYHEAAQRDLRAKWESLPGAAAHLFLLSLRLDGAGVAMNLDGNYVGRVNRASRLKEAVFPLPEDTAVQCLPGGKWEPWLCLDLRSLNRPSAMANAVLNVEKEALKAQGVPMHLAGGENADVGCVRDVSPPVNIDDCIYRYLERSALEGMPEALLMSVPVAPYTRAWVLAASEDDPAKDSVFMVRLTRYRPGGIGNAMVTTPVDVPLGAEAGSPSRWCVGSVSYGAKDGKKTVPLWLAEVNLNSSEIQDVLYADWTDGRLDFELMGQSRNSKSGVHVFAVTLERSPAEMEVKQAVTGSVFHNEEQPEMKVALRPRAACRVTMRWTVEDVWGNVAATEQRQYAFEDGAGPQEVPVPLKMKDYGWYRAVFSLYGENDRLLLAHTAAFAQLPPDTRKAGYESPFGCWWQQYLHSHMTDPKVIGPLLFKAGIRRTTGTAGSETNMNPWKVTIDMVPWGTGYRPPGSPEPTPEEWLKEYEKKVRECLEKFPNTGLAMVFHESYGETWLAPESWWGEPRPLSAFSQIERAKLACGMLRQEFPQLKVIVGNSGWSGALISQLLRGGLPPDQIDGLGMERLIGYFPKDTMPPERHEASWAMRQIGLKYGCRVPPSDCYESGGRGNYGMSQRLIAEYVVRDSLVGLAWGYPYIGLGVISENVNGYYHTRWGGDSILRRQPLLYPQPQYVALATMTRALDSVKLLRRVPTGSHTAYTLEFARGDERVYVLWTPRGTCEMLLKFPKDGAVTIDSLYGQTRQAAVVNGELRLQASEEVTYVTAPMAAADVTAGQRSFPVDQPPTDTVTLAPLTEPSAWAWASTKGVECGPLPYGWLPWRTAGKGRLSAATDPEKGPCLRLELVPEGDIPELLAESLSLQARAPLPVPGRPSTIGIWVKGNSCWGRVMFEVMDAEGERFRGGEGLIEPRGTSYINFDGWCFVSLPLSDKSPVRDRFLSPPARLWAGNGGNGVLDYPIRVTGLIVELKRKSLDLAEMATVDPAVLLKDISVYGSPGDMTIPLAQPSPPAALATDEAQKVLYSDGDLRFVVLGARPPGFAEGCVLREEGGRRFISCPQGTSGLFRNLGYHGAQNWLDYEWSFRFRFPAKDRLGFSCQVKTGIGSSPFLKAPPMGPEDRCKWISVEFSAEGVNPSVVEGMFQMARGGRWADKGLPPLEAGRWYRAVIRAAGKALDISLEHESKLVKIYRGPIPAGGGGVGLNSPNPLDLADIEIREAVPTAEDWDYAGRVRAEGDSPVPGTKCVRIDGPFMVSDSIPLAAIKRPCVLSAYIRAERDGVPVTMIQGNRTKAVPATPDWRRYSFLAMPPTDARTVDRCLFGLKGSEEGVVWVAAPQVELAPFDPDAKRTANWARTLEEDYEVDEQVAHRGRRSFRSMKATRSMAVQEAEFAVDESRPLVFGAWHRADGTIKEAKLHLELYRDRKYWSPKTPGEEEPRETFVLDLKVGTGTWTYACAKANPRKSVKRYRLSVVVVSAGGTLWLDDFVLRPVGAQGASPEVTGSLDEALREKAGVVRDSEEDDAVLGALDDGAEDKRNVLVNPGFEELTTEGVVTPKSDRPSPYGAPANTWLKAASDSAQ